MSSNDSVPNVGSKRNLFSSLRDVLFESTQQAPITPSAGAMMREEPLDAEVEAAQQVLRAAVLAELGEGVKEFTLQNQALLEALPDEAVRRRAALRVLSLKGTSPEHLSAELEHALAVLTAQGQAFARKLQGRRADLQTNEQACGAQYEQQSAAIEGTIARLRAELEAQQRALSEALTERDQTLAVCQAARSELGLRERGFQLAFQGIQEEYQSLKAQLSKESL